MRPGIGISRYGLLGFAVAAAYWPGLLSAAYVPRWAVIAVGVPAVSSLRLDCLDAKVRVLIAALLCYGLTSLAVSPDPLAGLSELCFICFLGNALTMASSLEHIDDLMLGFAYGMVVSVALVVSWYTLGWSPLPYWFAAAGLFYNTEVLGETAALIAVWALVERRWSMAAVLMLPVVTTGSRVGVLSIAVALIYVWRPSWKVIAFATLCAFWLALMAVIAVPDFKFHSAGLRAVIWGATAMAITPLGNGLGWFQAAHPSEQFAHSDALQAMAELGVGSVLVFALAGLAWWRGNGKLAERATFVAVCVQAAVSFPIHMPAAGFLAAVLAGHLVGDRSVVCLGRHIGRIEDGGGLQWRAASDGSVA
jgi:hypothetical protein